MISTAGWSTGPRADYDKLNRSLSDELRRSPRDLQNAWGKGGSQGTRAVYVGSSVKIERCRPEERILTRCFRKKFDRWFRDLTNRLMDVHVNMFSGRTVTREKD